MNTSVLKRWLPLATLVVLLAGLIYVVAQQSYRQGLNDPQIQMAEDTALALEKGGNPRELLPVSHIDPTRSLSPFMIILNHRNEVVASSIDPNGAAILPPSGVFDVARKNGQDRFSWQTANGQRYATVIQRVNGDHPGFVLAARNMKEVERRIDNLTLMTALALGLSLVVMLAVALVIR
jgi:hypothetical protein